MKSLTISTMLILCSVGLGKAPRENVETYFLEVAASAFTLFNSQGVRETGANLKKRITVRDHRNGYLEIDTKNLEAMESALQAALFQTKKGPILALAYERGDSSDDLQFFQKGATGWTDVTKEIFESPADRWVDDLARRKVPELAKNQINLSDCASGTFKYVLPRAGKTIGVILRSDCITQYPHDRTLFEVVFDGQKFRPKK